ncbi:MAG: methyltransferase domain-containing protein, partial [Pyrinomonadaceae bacterium]
AEIRGNKSSEVSVLDVGAGTGELTARVARELDGRRAYVVGADSSEHAVNAIADKGIQGVQCDALQLPFADKSFDYVFSTLFLHHLRDDAAVKLIREMLRVSQRKIFVIDLERRPLAYIFYRAFGRLFFQPFTRDDGALSILRAFNPSELRNIAKLAEMKNIRIRRSHLNRLILSGTN